MTGIKVLSQLFIYMIKTGLNDAGSAHTHAHGVRACVTTAKKSRRLIILMAIDEEEKPLRADLPALRSRA